jgi:uncharacterized glyoxalase superfamily protein PhnB
MSQVQSVPPDFHTITPHLTVRDADRAIAFYQNAFDAEIINIARAPDGRVMHALLKVGDSMLMLNDGFPEFGTFTPHSRGSSSVTLHIYTPNVDRAWDRAVTAGAQVKMPLMDQFWGDRYGVVADPFGHKWSLATHVKDMSPEELERARAEAVAKMPSPQVVRKTA